MFLFPRQSGPRAQRPKIKAKGVPSRLVYYPDEGHWILKPQNSLHWYGEFLGWLERHIGRPIPKPE